MRGGGGGGLEGWRGGKIDPPAILGLIILDSGIKVNKKYYPQTLLK